RARWFGGRRGLARPRTDGGEAEAVAQRPLAHLDRDGRGEHRTGEAEGMELAPLSAGIDTRRKRREQLVVEQPPGERLRQLLRIDAGEDSPQATCDHGARERGGVSPCLPEREQ